MTLRVLWPRRDPNKDNSAELEGLGENLEAIFGGGMDNVTEDQWATCDGIVGTQPSPEIMAKIRNCKIFVKTAVGYDDVDVEAWTARNIPVCNCPDYGTREVADHTMALMLAIFRGITYHDQLLHAHPDLNWHMTTIPFAKRLSTLTLGLIGFGRIAVATAVRAKAFEIDVVFYDANKPNGIEHSLGVRRADSMEGLLRQSDVVSIHAPLNKRTNRMFNTQLFYQMKRGSVLLNTARGPIVDLDALYDAMKKDIVLAAGLDVLPEEPMNVENKLIKAWLNQEEWIKHRLVITPHTAFITPESMYDIRRLTARTAARYLRDGVLENCVNRDQLHI
ncbi:MAG: C-terminal binding protein [Gammaproteobacteria bacterium]|nr:C-terminal binding protein [Gammaproteobacteria bacterium]MYC25538.1 C-terminal binding protein [Gammaproteobacteria bacterium]